MKPANDPNRQQPTTPVRPAAPTVVRTTSSTTHSVVTTNVTSHIVSTGNPTLPCVKTIPVTGPRVLPHTSTTTLTLVGSGTSTLRPVTTSPAITSFHVAKAPTAAFGPRGALASAGMRTVVSSSGISASGQGPTASFVPGIRALTRPAGSLTAVTTVPPGWGGGIAGKPGATTPTKISAQPGPRAASSLTVTTRPMMAQTRPELATVRTTKPVAPTDKFSRAPAGRTTLGFAPSPGQPGPLQGSPLTHLAVTTLPTGQSSPGLTLQPVVVGTASGPPKSVVTARHTALHPIGPKMITQPAHLQIAHLAGVAGKPGGQPGALQIARGPAPQAGTPFASAPAGTQVKVLAPQGAGALLSDVLSQQSGTTLIPPGSVFIQATQHVSQLERGTVVTSAGYTLPGGSYFYEANASGGSLIAAGPAHQPHQLIRTFPSSVTQGGVALQVQTSSFTTTDDRKAFSGSVVTSAAGSVPAGRFNPVMVVEASSRQVVPTPTSQQEGSSDHPPGQQQQQQHSGPSSSHSSNSGAQLPSQQPQPPPQQQQGTSAPPMLASSSQQGGPNHVCTAQGVANLLPSTPTNTPSKFSASPRPSILRKREHDGTPSKAQKNLSAMLAAMSSSPPPSPPTRPDSRDGKDHQGGNSSAGSSTISATSSPGLPCDGDNNGGSQGSLAVKSELVELADAANSNNGTNGNSDAMSPRKKPRKQQLTGNELQEPPYSDENAEFAEDKVKKEGQEGNHKVPDGSPGAPGRGAAAAVPTRRRPSVSLLQAYRSCWKPRNNHFLRPADVRPREERRPTVAELSSQKRVVQRAKGWKLHHLSTQLEDMAEREADVLGQLSEVLGEMEQPRPGHEPGRDLNRTSELIRSNLQRSKVVRDQLDECRSQLLRLLDHTSPVIDIIKRNANRRQAKKKY